MQMGGWWMMGFDGILNMTNPLVCGLRLRRSQVQSRQAAQERTKKQWWGQEAGKSGNSGRAVSGRRASRQVGQQRQGGVRQAGKQARIGRHTAGANTTVRFFEYTKNSSLTSAMSLFVEPLSSSSPAKFLKLNAQFLTLNAQFLIFHAQVLIFHAQVLTLHAQFLILNTK